MGKPITYFVRGDLDLDLDLDDDDDYDNGDDDYGNDYDGEDDLEYHFNTCFTHIDDSRCFLVSHFFVNL